MQMYKVLKSKQSLGVTFLSKTGASLVTSGTPGEYVLSGSNIKLEVCHAFYGRRCGTPVHLSGLQARK